MQSSRSSISEHAPPPPYIGASSEDGAPPPYVSSPSASATPTATTVTAPSATAQQQRQQPQPQPQPRRQAPLSQATPSSASPSSAAPPPSSLPQSRNLFTSAKEAYRSRRAAKEADRKVQVYEKIYGFVPKNVMTEAEWRAARARAPKVKKKVNWGAKVPFGPH